MRFTWTTAVWAVGLLLSPVCGTTADESETGALLKFGRTTHRALSGQEWEVSPGQFGFHDYGGNLAAYLVLPANQTYGDGCVQEPAELNQYIHSVEDFNPDNENFILLLNRGGCYFVEKVEHAQAIGAAGVIVMDYKDENLFTMWPPENWHDDVTIPSVLLNHNHSVTLMKALGVRHWSPTDMSNTTYPDVSTLGTDYVLATLEWGLPHDDDRVEWSIWTSANDLLSIDFKNNFKDVAIALSKANQAVFTPEYYNLNGSHWYCDSPSLPCSTQCTNMGRYCSVDPNQDLEEGVSGFDVVQENVRQTCVWQYATEQEDEAIWWDYTVLWDSECFNVPNVNETFTEECSQTQMDKVKDGLVDYVAECVAASGGYGMDTDAVNTILEASVFNRERLGVYALPTIVVNEFLVHGNIDCADTTVTGCQPLDAICAGFLEGTAPEICSEGCSEPKEYDLCDQCLDTTDLLWNDCLDCKNEPHGLAEVDCKGMCGGYAVWVTCDDGLVLCVDERSPNYASTCEDLQPTDGTGTTTTKTTESSSTTLIVIVSIVTVLVICVAGGIIYHLWKRQKAVDKRFTTLMKQYTLMDERDEGGRSLKTSGPTLKTQDEYADDEEDK